MGESRGTAVDAATGLDVGDKYSNYCGIGEDGAVRAEGRLRTTPKALEEHFAPLRSLRIALEVGRNSPWIRRLLKSCGHEVYVPNASRLGLIYGRPRKSDRTDAEELARLPRPDPRLLTPVRHRGEEAQNDLARLQARDALVAARTKLVNHVRGVSKAVGGGLSRCSTESFPASAAGPVPATLLPAVSPLLSTITVLTSEVRRCVARWGTQVLPSSRGVSPGSSFRIRRGWSQGSRTSAML